MNRWVQYNPNPKERRVGDCAIRACCKATGRSWDEVYWNLNSIATSQQNTIDISKRQPAGRR